MLVDNINLIIKAGNGGNGAATFLRNAMTAKGGPDGGNGGNGGNIYFQGSTNINDLREFRYKRKFLQMMVLRANTKNYLEKTPNI